MFQLSGPSADGLAKGPVFAVNALGIAENLSDLLAFSAPAVLVLEKNRTGSALAYFGNDGLFNALMDTYGGIYYLSKDALSRIDPRMDYAQYAKKNMTLIKNSSMIGFLDIRVPSSPQEASTTLIGPVVLSGSPLQNYGLKLEKAKAGMGSTLC
jgi:hypothetical protein